MPIFKRYIASISFPALKGLSAEICFLYGSLYGTLRQNIVLKNFWRTNAKIAEKYLWGTMVLPHMGSPFGEALNCAILINLTIRLP